MTIQEHTGIDVHPAKPDELGSIFELNQRIFGENGYSFATLRQLHDLWPSLLSIAYAQEEAVGFCIGAIGELRAGWIMLLGVTEHYRRRAVARCLMDATVRVMAQREARTLKLTVSQDNLPAVTLYESLGFRAGPLIQNYFGANRDKIIMSCAIRDYNSIAARRPQV